MAQNSSNSNRNIPNLGFLNKILSITDKYGFVKIMKALAVILIAGYTIFFATNPEYLIDKYFEVQELRQQQAEKDKAQAIEQRCIADSQIKVLLAELLYNSGADRTWVIELHNGTHNVGSGLPFLKGSMLHEEVRNGITHIDKDYQNFYLSKYPLVSHTVKDGYFWGSREKVKEIDERSYYNFIINDLSEIAMMTLYNNNIPMAVVGMSWCGDNRMEPEKAGRLIREYGTKVAVELLR